MTGLLSINNSSRESDSLDILKNPYLLRYLQIFFLAIIGVIIILGIGSLSDSNPVHALPEYSTHTGQACGTCHVNPGGGGPRTLRGLLWAAQGRPDVVPMLEITTSLVLHSHCSSLCLLRKSSGSMSAGWFFALENYAADASQV